MLKFLELADLPGKIDKDKDKDKEILRISVDARGIVETSITVVVSRSYYY